MWCSTLHPFARNSVFPRGFTSPSLSISAFHFYSFDACTWRNMVAKRKRPPYSVPRWKSSTESKATGRVTDKWTLNLILGRSASGSTRSVWLCNRTKSCSWSPAVLDSSSNSNKSISTPSGTWMDVARASFTDVNAQEWRHFCSASERNTRTGTKMDPAHCSPDDEASANPNVDGGLAASWWWSCVNPEADAVVPDTIWCCNGGGGASLRGL